MGRTFIDDNFGVYDIEDQDDVDFYFDMQSQSIEKTCAGCGRTVRLKPDYAYCNSCATRIEQGGDI